MNSDFTYEAELFYNAQQCIIDACEIMKQKRSIINTCTSSFPNYYEYKNEVLDICNNISTSISSIIHLERDVSDAKDRLISLDSAFATIYFQCAASKYSDVLESLTDEQQKYVEYLNEKYNENLYRYLSDLKSNGLLTPEYENLYKQLEISMNLKNIEDELSKLDVNSKEYQEKYKDYNDKLHDLLNIQIKELESKESLSEDEQERLKTLKDNVNLSDLQAELDELNKNPVKMPNVPGGRMSETQVKAYKKETEKYGEYYKKKQELEHKIEAIQKSLGTYKNKWYEDIGEAFSKTGSAWKTACKTKSATDVVSATKQTVATGAVIYTSARSGLAKITELVDDGIAITAGSIAAGVTWLFHDTWSDKDLAGSVMDNTLDFVKRDLVGEANKNFYKNNPIGKWINENSNLKYDSAGAKSIQKASKFAVEVAVATAAEIGSFGTATPLITAMFALEGAGEAAESYTQSVNRNSGESYNYAAALGSAALGAFSGAMKGKMYGKIGANTFNILKDPSLIKTGIALLKETGAKKILTNELKSTSFWVDFLTTGVQKSGEVVNEYHQTGNINWGKAFTSFAGELLYARFTDKLTANSIDEIINQKTIFQTVKDISSKFKNVSKNTKILINDFFHNDKFDNLDDAVDSSVSYFIKESVTDGYFGVSQESTSRYKAFTIKDVDWLSKNSTDLELFLKTNYNLEDAATYIERWKQTGEINDFTKGVLEKFIYESNPKDFDGNINLINNLFGIKELPEYIRQKNILMKKGLSEIDSIKILDSFDNTKYGIANCTYASTANAIFSQFDGKENEFKKIFGFDMYVEIDGVKRLNGNELIIDMYTYMNSDLNKNQYHPGKLLSIDSNGNMKLNDINATRVRANSNSILNEYFNSKGLNNELTENCLDFTGLRIDKNNFEKELNIDLSGEKSYKLDLRCTKNNNFGANKIPIEYYDSSGNLLIHMDNSGHSVFITGISDKGVECSSWGKKCYIPFSCFSGNKSVTIMSVDLEV